MSTAYTEVAVPQKSDSKPPVDELGVVLQGTLGPSGMMSWGIMMDDQEYVPELKWPHSIKVYDEMRTDAQLSALYKGTTLPIRRFDWYIIPNGAPDDMVQACAQDLNLPIQGEKKVTPRRRSKGRFDFANHMRLAMRGLIYGHAYFEQVGYIGDDGKWHLKKLAERPQKNIANIGVADDGGLVYIQQNITSGNAYMAALQMPAIPVDNLVAYIWEQEDGSWLGRSAMRDCYKNWLCKDKLVRIDVINHGRAGGVPYVVGQPGATPAELDELHKMARDFKIGEQAGGAIPYGAEMQIARAGNTDVVNSMRYHDEAMARQWLLMMLQLGMTTSGSRALGRTFHEFFAQGQAAVADWFTSVFNMHVIEDYVDWNWGDTEEFVPLLGYDQDIDLALAEINSLITSGAIVLDRDLEVALRKETGLPPKMDGAPDPVPLAPRQPSGLGADGQGQPPDSQHPPKPTGTTKQGTGSQ
jgi:hypothetical protein